MTMTQGGFAEVVALLQQGQHARAATRGKALIALQPNNPKLLHLVGVACAQSGDPQQAANLLGRALKLAPSDAGIRHNLVRALIDSDDIAQAETICAAAPASARSALARSRADIAKRRGRHDEAAAILETIVAATPADHEALNNLGNARIETGDMIGAIEALERARALRPDHPLILFNLGKALAGAARYADSLAVLEQAARLAPKDATVLLELGRALNRVGRNADALPVLADAARIDGRADILLAIALTFADMGEFDRAEQGYRLALDADRTSGAAYLNYGILLEQANRLDELEALVADATANGVAGEEVAYLRAVLLRRRGQLAEALGIAESLSGDKVDAILLEQLKGQLNDRLGNPAKAFAAFAAMNRAMAREPVAAGFDGTEHSRFVDSLRAMTTRSWYDGWPSISVPDTPPAPVFLVGFPRSGTTLLDTVLMGHPDTHVLEELPILAHVRDQLGDIGLIDELDETGVAELRAAYFEELRRLAPPPSEAMVIDKLPLNILRTPLIHRLFPDARFIFATRHPCDAVLSCFMQSFKVNQAMASFLDLGNAARFYDRTMAYWKECRGVFPLRVHRITYENMVADLESELRPLIGFLGLDWTDDLLAFQRTASERALIRTPSYAQVTEGIYDRARGRWERYRDEMRDVLPILAPWTEELGYPPIAVDATP